MPRLPFLDESFGKQNFQRVYAHSPNGALKQSQFHGYLREQSPLDRRLRELAIMQVGYAANCPYAYSHHVKAAVDAGVPDADIRAVADEDAGRPTSLEPLAKAVLRAARDLTTGYTVSDATFAALQEGLDKEQIMDLLFTITCYTSMSKLLLSLQVELEDHYRPYLERFPIET
jgi:alkylhydroperoxidase family enzyme